MEKKAELYDFEKEQEVLNILMGSSLYLELALHERYLLVKRIAEYYRDTIKQNVL